jgi:beta-galactosidase
LTAEGTEIAGGAFELPALGPGERAMVEIPGWAPEAGSGEEFLTVRITTAEASDWAPHGFEVCAVQLPLREDKAPVAVAEPAADTDAALPLADDGLLRHPAFAAPPTLALWRAPTDNDRIGGMAARWAEAGIDRLERRLVGMDRRGPVTVVRSVFTTAAGIEVPHEATYTLLSSGGLSVDETVDLPDALEDIPRVGTILELRPGHETLRWFGSGPHETYPDRKRGGLIGTWDSTVTDQYVPYIRPQENGGHADVRWLEVTLEPNESTGIRIELDEPRQVSVTHLRAADLAAAAHDIDVVPVAETVIHLDAAHRGLGTASCGPDTLPEYRLTPGTYHWRWVLRGVRRA